MARSFPGSSYENMAQISDIDDGRFPGLARRFCSRRSKTSNCCSTASAKGGRLSPGPEMIHCRMREVPSAKSDDSTQVSGCRTLETHCRRYQWPYFIMNPTAIDLDSAGIRTILDSILSRWWIKHIFAMALVTTSKSWSRQLSRSGR